MKLEILYPPFFSALLLIFSNFFIKNHKTSSDRKYHQRCLYHIFLAFTLISLTKQAASNDTTATSPLAAFRGVRRGVSKVVEDGSRPPALRAATPETAIRTFQGWPPTGHGKVEHTLGSPWPPLEIRPCLRRQTFSLVAFHKHLDFSFVDAAESKLDFVCDQMTSEWTGPHSMQYARPIWHAVCKAHMACGM
jgi:hypothetical protein